MESSPDELRKKRDSAQVDQSEGEKSKKVRVQTSEKKSPCSSRRVDVGKESKPSSSKETAHTPSKDESVKSLSGHRGVAATRRIWDIESALLHIVQVGTDEKEFLSRDGTTNPWVTYRAGHAGDASTIASWYIQSDDSPELEVARDTVDPEDDTSSSMLEVWLADGLGDEGNPPAVHALLGHVHDETKDGKISTALAVIALMTLDWEAGQRTLRVQWMQIDPRLSSDVAKILEQRTWLRISVLAQMTACQVVGVEAAYTQVNAVNITDAAPVHPVPSAE